MNWMNWVKAGEDERVVLYEGRENVRPTLPTPFYILHSIYHSIIDVIQYGQYQFYIL